ncbi:hypothetical protein NQ318_001447 [Aromia moschata]|uniref:VWFA domain-containing protein n=1 Tax=Aromia moschata TaxID=1265417 RepID=A0AAV8YVT1_9CUCU|nr:hypothetical protein NQ318_001447 [Aromia moschata]
MRKNWDPSADIQKINSTTAIVKFSPDPDKQKQYAQYLGGKNPKAYQDNLWCSTMWKKRSSRWRDSVLVLLQDGYFIHFFAPSDLEPLPKHVVFVLDTSGSMDGTKISQLKDAMKSILSELRKGDIVNIIEFNFDASVWDINNQSSTAVPSLQNKYEEPFPALSVSRHDPRLNKQCLKSRHWHKPSSKFSYSKFIIIQVINPALPIKVTCWGPRGPIDLKPVIERPVTSLERLWAYLTVKQTLDKRDSAENKTELTKKALDLALKYSFVTDVTSLVVGERELWHHTNLLGSIRINGFAQQRLNHAKPSVNAKGWLREPGTGGPGPYGLTTFGRRPSPLVPSGAIADRTLVNIRTEAADVVDPIFGQSSFNQDADTYITRPRPFVVLTSTTTKPLLNDLPWLSSALNSNGTLTVGQGTYDLGETSTVATSNDECTKTPLNATGECTLLKDCSEVYQYLTDFQVYQQYFCALDNK